MPTFKIFAALLFALFLAACDAAWVELEPAARSEPVVENYSYARLDEARVTHIELDLTVDFEARRLHGTAALDLDRADGAERLWLDTWDLAVESVRDAAGADLEWTLGEHAPLLGRPLEVTLAPDTRRVVVHYATGDDARGVQWLDGEQTSSGRPFLYTQSQAILARSWVPCQDTTAARVTYDAKVKVPSELLALMSAVNPTAKRPDGVYSFEMPQPIPTYLLALAVGDLEYRSLGNPPDEGGCCGVYAEPGIIEAAAWEFADTERMMAAAEGLYGPYRWQRFDLLVLPPSFPYGGMENPRLTFLTPVLVAGDRSLVSTVAHELAHSWSGNLVTNATWNDFWLNEGFTTYFERRIMEEVEGRDVVEMHAILGRADLDQEIAAQPAGEEKDTALYIPLEGRDPDEELGTAPYDKGYLFLRLLEETVGREAFDRFLRQYFDAHAFQTMTTSSFLELLHRDLLGGDEALADQLKIDEWVWQGGLPDNAPKPRSSAFEQVEAVAAAFAAGTAASQLDVEGWITPHWEHFLAQLPSPLEAARLVDLDTTFSFSTANGVIRRSWFNVVIESDYREGYDALEAFLLGIGRTWLLRPLYQRLAATEEGLEFARDVYARARPGYHSTTRSAIERILDASG